MSCEENKLNISEASLLLTKKISDEINNQTFHHHYHILFDIANNFYESELNYVEIGCYAGGSSCLMLQRPKTNVVAIDLGYPISKEVVIQNVEKLNIHSNKFYYLQGNSKSKRMIEELDKIYSKIDILFIDGDHSYKGVIEDFNLYEEKVSKGGFIIFDDYNDEIYSPEVKIAVDFLCQQKNIIDKYEFFGTIKNKFKARPENMVEGNCFIYRKRI